MTGLSTEWCTGGMLAIATRQHSDPAAALLTSPEVESVLARAVGTSGGTLDRWEVRAVHARPGAETSVGYDAIVSGSPQYLVASTVELTDAERARARAVRLDSSIGSLHVWAHPADPRLPGLAAACTPEAVAQRLSGIAGAAVEVSTLDLVVHRPLRRAVVRVQARVDGATQTWFLKVLRPDKAPEIAERHALLGGTLAPQTVDLGDGVLAIARARGTSLANSLAATPADRQRDLIDPARYIEALRSLPPEATSFEHRKTPTEKVRTYARSAINRGLDGDQVEALADAVERLSARATGPLVATHGDFNVANIFLGGVAGDLRVEHLIDVDTLGPGRLIDDIAGLVAHLSVLPSLDPARYAGVAAHVEAVLVEADTHMDPVGLRARAGASLMSLAAGCPDDARAVVWFDLAKEMVARAETMMRELS